MTNRLRLGLVFPPALPPESIRPLAGAVDAAGLDDFWLSEDCFKESAVASAVAALSATERVRVGIGILPVPLRSVAQAAIPGGSDTGAAGTATTIADRILELGAAGVTTVAVQPCQDEPDLNTFIHFVADEVMPLLK